MVTHGPTCRRVTGPVEGADGYVRKLKGAGFLPAGRDGDAQVYCRAAVDDPAWAPREATMAASVVIGVCAAALVLLLPLRRRSAHDPAPRAAGISLTLVAAVALLAWMARPYLRLVGEATVGTIMAALFVLALTTLGALGLAALRGRPAPAALFVTMSLLLAAAGSLAHGLNIGEAMSEIAVEPDGSSRAYRALFAASGWVEALELALFGCVAAATVLVLGLVSTARPKWPLGLNLAALWSMALFLGFRRHVLDTATSESHFADRAAYVAARAATERQLGWILAAVLIALLLGWLASSTGRRAARFRSEVAAAAFGLLGLGAVLAGTLDGGRQVTRWFASIDALYLRESKLQLPRVQSDRSATIGPAYFVLANGRVLWADPDEPTTSLRPPPPRGARRLLRPDVVPSLVVDRAMSFADLDRALRRCCHEEPGFSLMVEQASAAAAEGLGALFDSRLGSVPIAIVAHAVMPGEFGAQLMVLVEPTRASLVSAGTLLELKRGTPAAGLAQAVEARMRGSPIEFIVAPEVGVGDLVGHIDTLFSAFPFLEQEARERGPGLGIRLMTAGPRELELAARTPVR